MENDIYMRVAYRFPVTVFHKDRTAATVNYSSRCCLVYVDSESRFFYTFSY